MLGGISLIAAIRFPSMLVAVAVVAGGALLLRLQARRIVVVPLVLLAGFAVGFHRSTAEARADLTARLDHAIAERNRGNLESASAQFDAIAHDHPTSYVPLALGAELDYRRNALELAQDKLTRAVAMKQDFIRGYRLLAAINLQRGQKEQGVAWALRGLEVAPGDLQLRFLAGEDVLAAIDTPQTAAGMAALAYEVGELSKAQQIVESGVTRWPGDARLRGLSARLRR